MCRGRPVLTRIFTIARFTLLETIRQRVPMVLALFGVLLCLGALFLGELSVRQDEKLLTDFGLAAIDLFANIIAVFLGTDLIAKEIQRRSLYPLLAKPLRRHELILGRYLGLVATLGWNVALMGLGLMAILFTTFGRADAGLSVGVFGIFLSLALLAAISVLFSSTSTFSSTAVRNAPVGAKSVRRSPCVTRSFNASATSCRRTLMASALSGSATR